MLDAGITFLMNNLKIGGKVVGLVREEKLELPIEAMREALINALCHRQIERTLANVTLAIYDVIVWRSAIQAVYHLKFLWRRSRSRTDPIHATSP